MWYPLIEIVFHWGTRFVPNSNVSTTSRIEGSGGKIHSFCAWYSFRMSFWIVPRRRAHGIPRFSAFARYIAQITEAGELIVIDVDTAPISIPPNRISMSRRDGTATPQVPNSPFASGSSVSYPYRVGMSDATLSPVSPWSIRYLNRRFVSSALPYPENIRIVQRRPRYIVGWIPRVYGNSPGTPSFWRTS